MIKLKKLAVAVGVALLAINTAHAEFFGLLNGRSANPAGLPALTAEGGINFGDDYQVFGARVNYRVGEEIVVFGDFGLVDVGILDGTSFGFGAFYHLANQRFLQNFDVAVKGSYHLGTLDVDFFGSNAEADVSNISFEALVSSQQPISENGMNWYVNGGLNLVDFDFTDSSEILLGGGVYLPFGPGEAYAGIDIVDELTFGAGFRYFVQ